VVTAGVVAWAGLTACGATPTSQPPPAQASGESAARDAYLASLHQDVWFDGTDDDVLLRIGVAVCAGLDHDSPVPDMMAMAAAHQIPVEQVRELMRAATQICPQHQDVVEAHLAAGTVPERLRGSGSLA